MWRNSRLETRLAHFVLPAGQNPRFMSEFTRAQILSLMKQAADAIRHSDEIRRELEVVMKRIEETGYAAQNENRKAKPATGEMGTGRTRTRNRAG